jgi:SpoIID/LytB domain protein
VISPSVTPNAPVADLLVLCRHDGVDESLRGAIEAYDRSGFERTLNLVPMESYLRGVVPSESSASWGNDGTSVGAPQGRPWGFQALEAQAVAARSYAIANIEAGGWNGYAGICDSTACQVYSGANYETGVTNVSIVRTSGQIRVMPSSPTAAVSTPFSASTGGFTSGATFPAVRDLGDICVVPSDPTQCNPSHTWQETFRATAISRHFRAIGSLVSVHVSARNGHGSYGGRALTVVLHGTRSVISVPAYQFVVALGLKSEWFVVARTTRVVPVTSTTVPTTTVPATTVPATTVPATTVPATTVPATTVPATTTTTLTS